MYLADHAKIVEAIKPQTGASARSGDWVSLKGYSHLTIIVQLALGNAATTAITVDKASAVDGSGNSDGITLNNWYKGTPSTDDSLSKGTAGASITTSNAGAGSELYVIEIDAAELGEGYDCVQVELGQSHSGNLVSALYVLSGARYAAQAANMPSAIVD